MKETNIKHWEYLTLTVVGFFFGGLGVVLPMIISKLLGQPLPLIDPLENAIVATILGLTVTGILFVVAWLARG